MRTVKLDPEMSPCAVQVITSLSSMLCSSGLKTAGGVLSLVSVTCLLALLSVNSDIIIFHYLFAGFSCVQVSSAPPSGTSSDPSLSSLLFCRPTLQGPFVFFFRVVFNKEARSAMKYCCSRKRPDSTIKSKASVSLAPSHIFRHLLEVCGFFSNVLDADGSSARLCFQGYKCGANYADGQLYHLPFGDSSASLNGTMQSGKSQQSYVPFLLR